MRRVLEPFLHILGAYVPLFRIQILEIGCGTGERAAQMAKDAAFVAGIDPDIGNINAAKRRREKNLFFHQESAQRMSFKDGTFDLVLFSLSFHHVPLQLMLTALDEALRVLKPDGHLVFLEPGELGTFFEAELRFEAGDGDERLLKKAAYQVMRTSPRLEPVVELWDQTAFEFESTQDFITAMRPKKNLHELDVFLARNRFVLDAKRRINIYKPLPQP